MKQYILPILGAVAVGVGGAWLLTTSVTLAYRGVKGSVTLDYQTSKEKGEDKIEKKISVTARAYLLADLETGKIIVSRQSETSYPIASITKLMTALISLEKMNQSNLLTFGAQGEKFSVEDLLYPLLLESNNEAAEALARAHGRDSFIALMNEKAKTIGLKQTTFADPSGISGGNRSTAQDLLTFIDYLYREQRHLLTLTQLRQKRLGQHLWLNNNHLVSAAGFLGGKTGKTVVARQTLVSILDLPRGDGTSRPIAIILLQSDDRDGDATALLDYLQTTFVPHS